MTLLRVKVPALVKVLTRVSAGRFEDTFCGTGRGRRAVGGGSGLGRGAAAFGVASQAVRGVTRPGSASCGRSVLWMRSNSSTWAVQLLERVGQGLLVEVAEQGLVEPFVLALGRRLGRLAGDRLGSQSAHVCHELADVAAAGRVERRAVVAEQPLGHAVGGDGLVHYGDRAFGGLAPCHVRRDRVARVVVDELEDHALAPTGQDVLRRIQLPAGVRRRIHEPPPR
ncbi:hypothetical protein GCM10027054_30050 [Isoptericola nanjingensis]